jgi:hypothetical protein
MCTVTYVPVKGGFYLTTNRDEKINRTGVTWPVKKEFEGYQLLYPQDLKGRGTWIAADNRNNSVCLINGAFLPHVSKEKYRKSRGLVVLDFFSFKKIRDFIELYNLTDIEQFTLVIIWAGELFEFRWDGETKHIINFPIEKPRIWSSVTLYSPAVIKLKEAWFSKWLNENEEINYEKILEFHQSDGTGDPENAIKMKRKEVQTLSITSVHFIDKKLSMQYLDIAEEPFPATEYISREYYI